MRAATLERSSAVSSRRRSARGERTSFILRREVLPNIALPVLADAGVRLTGSILLVASVNFLGLGLQPPAADWALMISENRSGLTIQPWAAVAPILLIATLTIAVNLVADAFARGLGRSVERAGSLGERRRPQRRGFGLGTRDGARDRRGGQPHGLTRRVLGWSANPGAGRRPLRSR